MAALPPHKGNHRERRSYAVQAEKRRNPERVLVTETSESEQLANSMATSVAETISESTIDRSDPPSRIPC